MNYNDALLLKEQNMSLIGQTDERGFTIGDILILPIDENEQKMFFREYLSTWDAESAIAPFVNSELQVWTIDKDYLLKASILFYNQIG